MRTALFLLLITGPLAADVVLLKDGRAFNGRVSVKPTHFEVKQGTVLRTFLKEEVDKVLKNPKEILGNADALYVEARDVIKKVVEQGIQPGQNPVLKSAIDKTTKAREIYARARDLFPESKYSFLDKKLMQVMMLMRIGRDRLGSEIARKPSGPRFRPSAAPANAPAGTLIADDALSVLRDALKRADASKRALASNAFKTQRINSPNSYDMATAAMLFLRKSDADWGLTGESLAALQEYFDQPWMKDPGKLTPKTHQEAAAYLAPRASKGRDALKLFLLAHLAYVPKGAERDKIAKSGGLFTDDGRVGTSEGLAVRDLNEWIINEDFDLAVLAFKTTHRKTDTPIVRFVWSYALLHLVHQKQREWDRPSRVMKSIKTREPQFKAHLGALARSIEAVASCNTCIGTGRLRCTNCHGKEFILFVCQRCKGKGFGVSKLGARLLCVPCKSTGYAKKLVCRKCNKGYFKCKQCKIPRPPPDLGEILSETDCLMCDGRGTAFRNAQLPCRFCRGLGLKLTPQSDPTKVLSD